MINQNLTTILVSDFVVPASIGIYPHEKAALQNICISMEVILNDYEIRQDEIVNTLSYEGLVAAMRDLQKQHFNLVEILAEHLAAMALVDDRVTRVKVRVEKLEVYPEGRVGTEIIRFK